MKIHFLFLVLFLNTVVSTSNALSLSSNDSIKYNQINEITVVGLSSSSLSLPYLQVSKSQIENKSYVSAADALQKETGIALYRDGIWSTSINVRGISEQRLMLLVDNDRIQTATDIAGALSTVDLNNIQKIEVVKGSASVLYGTSAMGGVVNFVTERPDFTSSLNLNANFTTGYNSVNSLWNNAVKIDITNHDWYLALTGSYRTAQNTKTPTGVLNNSQFNDASWGLKGGMKYGNNQQLMVNYNHFEAWNVGIPGSNSFLKTATVRYSGIERNQMSTEYIFTDISNLIRELRIKAYNQNISRDVEVKFKPNPNTTNLTLPSSINSTTGAKATANLYFNDYNKLTVGAESWVRKSEAWRTKIIQSVDTTISGEIPTPKAQMIDIGVFAHYKKVLDPRHLNLNAGVRLDYLHTSNDTAFNKVFQYKIINGVRSDVAYAKNTVFDAGVNNNFAYAVHIDLEYMPVTQHKLVFSVANAYRVASIEERFKYIDLGNGVKLGKPDLKPENGLFSNLSYVFNKRKLLIKVEVFANYLFNMITEVKKSATPLIYENQNIDQALFTGAEMQLDWLISQNFRLNTNASYVYTQNITNGTFLPQIPPTHGMLALNYRLDKKFETAITTLWAATQNQVFDDGKSTSETVTPGHLIFNFDIHSMPINIKQSQIQLFAGIDNILNKAYKNHLFSNRGLDFYEPGRNIYIKVSLGL